MGLTTDYHVSRLIVTPITNIIKAKWHRKLYVLMTAYEWFIWEKQQKYNYTRAA